VVSCCPISRGSCKAENNLAAGLIDSLESGADCGAFVSVFLLKT
jgi:hypothetical protein